VAISDPATAHFTAIKTWETQVSHTNRGTRTPTHPETLEAREKTQVAISDTAAHKPKHARGARCVYISILAPSLQKILLLTYKLSLSFANTKELLFKTVLHSMHSAFGQASDPVHIKQRKSGGVKKNFRHAFF
jgi:hypothetical protein